MRDSSIFVTNKNDFTHVDQYDGVEYVFPPSERVVVPVAAAVHMFGFNMPDKTDVLHRLGWAMKIDPHAKKIIEDVEGVKKLARFVFTRAVLVEERLDDPDELATPAKLKLPGADMPLV